MLTGLGLEIRQRHSLVMTPQLMQAIKLLQMSNVELTEFINHQIEQNPLLMFQEPDSPSNHYLATKENSSVNKTSQKFEQAHPGQNNTILSGKAENNDQLGQLNTRPEFSSDNLEGAKSSTNDNHQKGYELGGFSDVGQLDWQHGGHSVRAARSSESRIGSAPDFCPVENVNAYELSLRDYLLAQVNVDFSDTIKRKIASALVEMLDDNGWFSGELETVSLALGCPISLVKETLYRCQHFDPAGVFSRSLAECLALQLREKGRLDPAMQKLIDNLPLLAKREFSTLQRLCGVTNRDLQSMVSEIRKLNPKPGLVFNNEIVQILTPDVFVRRGKTGWIVELNNDSLPKVLVNKQYYVEVKKNTRTKKDQKFISDHLQSANWLVRALAQRAETILKVATEIVVQQERFIKYGIEFLKPLTLRDIADSVGVHESTVSRVTANKNLSINDGIIPMKYLFNTGLGKSKSGGGIAAESVRARIKGVIEGERLGNVLSDESIVGILQNQGIEIARRTVAKYRYAMNIPSSVQRRREKAFQTPNQT